MTAVSDGATYGDLIVEALTRFPTREAFVIGERRVTYAQATEATGRLVAGLRGLGVGLGAGVALLSPNSPESWLLQAATYLLGGHFSGLQLLGSLDDHVFVCDDAAVTVLAVDEGHADQGEQIRARAATVKHLLIIGADGQIRGIDQARAPERLHPGPAGPEDVAWLQYTGGTTGRPKGVLLPHRAMVAQALALTASWGLPDDPRYLAASPISHAAVLPVLPTLLRGGTVVLQRAFDPQEWLRTVERERITFAFAVPTMIYALLDTAGATTADQSSLVTIAYGAAPMSPSRLLEAQERFGHVFLQVYGQTENAGAATSLRRDEHDPDRPWLLASCGRPLVGVKVAILDDEGNEVAPDQVGEIAVRSRTAMLGYHSLPEETTAVMRDGWVRSGDMGRKDEDGYVYIVDRKKDMIISGGFNVYAREVEDVLTRHPDVAAAAVIGIPDDKWGEVVHATIVPRAGRTIDPAAVTAFVKQAKGPLYAPSTVELLDALPTTTVGKIDKNALRAPHWAGQDRQVH